MLVVALSLSLMGGTSAQEPGNEVVIDVLETSLPVGRLYFRRKSSMRLYFVVLVRVYKF